MVDTAERDERRASPSRKQKRDSKSKPYVFDLSNPNEYDGPNPRDRCSSLTGKQPSSRAELYDSSPDAGNWRSAKIDKLNRSSDASTKSFKTSFLKLFGSKRYASADLQSSRQTLIRGASSVGDRNEKRSISPSNVDGESDTVLPEGWSQLVITEDKGARMTYFYHQASETLSKHPPKVDPGIRPRLYQESCTDGPLTSMHGSPLPPMPPQRLSVSTTASMSSCDMSVSSTDSLPAYVTRRRTTPVVPLQDYEKQHLSPLRHSAPDRTAIKVTNPPWVNEATSSSRGRQSENPAYASSVALPLRALAAIAVQTVFRAYIARRARLHDPVAARIALGDRPFSVVPLSRSSSTARASSPALPPSASFSSATSLAASTTALPSSSPPLASIAASSSGGGEIKRTVLQPRENLRDGLLSFSFSFQRSPKAPSPSQSTERLSPRQQPGAICVSIESNALSSNQQDTTPSLEDRCSVSSTNMERLHEDHDHLLCDSSTEDPCKADLPTSTNGTASSSSPAPQFRCNDDTTWRSDTLSLVFSPLTANPHLPSLVSTSTSSASSTSLGRLLETTADYSRPSLSIVTPLSFSASLSAPGRFGGYTSTGTTNSASTSECVTRRSSLTECRTSESVGTNSRAI